MFGRHRRHIGFESAAEHIPRGHGGHGGRGMRRRMFDSGHLRLVILDLIGETPRHGYDVIKALEARCGGLYSPSPGVVYPTLSLLEDQGFVTVDVSAGNKKRYTVTDEGRAHLAENQAFLNAINARLAMARSQEAHGEESVRRPSRCARAFARTARSVSPVERRGPAAGPGRRSRRHTRRAHPRDSHAGSRRHRQALRQGETA